MPRSNKTPTLFDLGPRRSPRVLMRVIDAGEGSHHAGRFAVYLECPRCGHQTGWCEVRSVTEARTQPCPKCNQRASR